MLGKKDPKETILYTRFGKKMEYDKPPSSSSSYTDVTREVDFIPILTEEGLYKLEIYHKDRFIGRVLTTPLAGYSEEKGNIAILKKGYAVYRQPTGHFMIMKVIDKGYTAIQEATEDA